MTPRTITGAHRIYVLPKERNKSEYVDYCAQSTTLVEALTKDSLVEHLIIKCSDPWGFVFPEQLVSQTEREKPLRITLLLTEHIDHVRGNLLRWEEFVARARTEGMLKGQVYKSGWQDCVVPRGVYVPSGLMTRIACRDKGKYASNFPDPTGGGKQEDGFTYRFITDASLATGSTAEELAQIRAYFGVDLSHSFKPIRKIKNGAVTNTQADMWVYEFLYARQMIEAHGASSGVYMNMLYWLNASEANVTDFWEVAEATEDTANKLEGKLDKPTNGSYVLDAEISDKMKDKIKGDTELQELLKGRDGKDAGRNLLLNSGDPRFQDGRCAVYELAYPIDREGVYFLSFDVAFDKNQLYTPYGYRMKVIFGYQTALERTGYIDYYESLHKGYSRLRLDVKKNSTYQGSAKTIYIYPNEDYENPDTDPRCGKFTIKNVMVEYGTKPTVWSPAPEDFLAELDKYTTVEQYKIDRADDKRELDKKLDKPTNGNYVLDKDIASQIGGLMKVGGRNLIVTKRWKAGYLYGDRDENAYPVGSENYKVLVGYDSFRFDPVYIPTLGESKLTYKLYDNGGSTNGTVQIHAYDKDKKFLWWDFDAWRGEIGRTRTYTLPADTSYIRLGVTNENVRAKVEFGNVATDWTPAPEDLFAELDKYIPLKQYNKNREEDKKELTTAKSKLTTDISNARSRADSAYDGAQKANAKIADANSEIKRINNEVVNQDTQLNAQGTQIIELKKNQLPEDVRKWLQHMGMLLAPDTEEQGSSVTLNGIRADHSIFLRFSDGKPSAMIGGSDAVLMAGVQNYGTDNLSARTEIYQDGSAKFGDVKLSDKTIALMPKSGLPLRVTAEDGTFIENFLANSKDDRNIAYEKSFVVVGKGEAQTYSFDVANNDTKLTITISKLTSEVYQINQSVILTLDGVTLGSWHGDTKLIKEDTSGIVGGGVHFRKENTPLVVENLQFERYLNSGSHTLSISVTSTETTDKASITKLTAHLYYDASQAETILTHKGFRAFGGQNRYFDIDRSATYLAKGYFTTSNPYIARVKGGMRVDSLTLEQPLDAPGCVLAAGEVDSSGSVVKSFGKYKKRRGDDRPYTTFDYDTKLYTIYHSIGNTNYIPVVTSRSSAWADVPRVMSIDSNSFTIKFINQENTDSNWRQMFIYVCYKAD